MLNLSLREVARATVPVRGEVSADDPMWQGAGVDFATPVAVDLQAQAVGDGVLVRGNLHAIVNLECRRCLATVSREIGDEITLLFDELPEGEEEEESGEIYPLPARGDELDLSEAIREQVLLRIPLHTLCRTECRGLCSMCGADLNVTTCNCEREPAPSAWDALKDLELD
ncbi:MAG TPA: DUF177 domain-containing protein [Longimicrobiaceae bacterium]|nr:DUF177 domain-containing protein [Longimicrobiaceae bacterium]